MVVVAVSARDKPKCQTIYFSSFSGNNDTIETLNISWNGFGPNGAKAIAKGLEVYVTYMFVILGVIYDSCQRY